MTAASILTATGHRRVSVFDGGPDTWSDAVGLDLEVDQFGRHELARERGLDVLVEEEALHADGCGAVRLDDVDEQHPAPG